MKRCHPVHADFNPTLVQLESFRERRKSLRSQSFQSHIGAIRIVLSSKSKQPTFIFQSHIGAIRIKRRGFFCFIESNFNPTLVQLEFFNDSEYCDILTFQSHIGAIRIPSQTITSLRELQNFNPTLVQLECFAACNQLHDGRISIPHWCNQNSHVGISPFRLSGISIPHWCNQNSLQRKNAIAEL